VIEIKNLLLAAILLRCGATHESTRDGDAGDRRAVLMMDLAGLDLDEFRNSMSEFVNEMASLPGMSSPDIEWWFEEESLMGKVDKRYRRLKGQVVGRRR